MSFHPAPPPEPSWRKPAGILLMLGLIAAWVVLIASFSGTVGGWHWAVQAVFYVVTGVGWIWLFPFAKLFSWMETGIWRR
jgi:hypothetical protein